MAAKQKNRFKLSSKYTGGCMSVVDHQGSALAIHKVGYSIVYNPAFADCLLRRGEPKSTVLYLVRHNLITGSKMLLPKRRELCCPGSRCLAMKCTKPKARGKVSLMCLPSQWRNSEIRQMVQMTFWKDHHPSVRLREEKARRGGGAIFLYSEGWKWIPKLCECVPYSSSPSECFLLHLNKFICLCRGLKSSSRSKKGRDNRQLLWFIFHYFVEIKNLSCRSLQYRGCYSAGHMGLSWCSLQFSPRRVRIAS